MKSIGDKLKQRRLELGYSIEDIHEKTKLSPVHIRAIENGDMDYFRHDLSYLKFFLQYYCQAVYLDFDEIKDDYNKVLDTYNATQAIKKQESTQASNENIQRRIQNHQTNYRKAKGSKNIQFKKIDNQTIVILVVILLLSALLIFGFFKLVYPRLTNQTNTPPVVDVEVPETPETPEEPTPTPTPTPEPTPEPEPTQGLNVTKVDYANYDVSGINRTETNFVLNFSKDTWIQVFINDTATNNPETKVYGPGSQAVIPFDDTVNKVTVHFGNLGGTNILINDTEVEIDDLAKQSSNGVKLNFHFKGE